MPSVAVRSERRREQLSAETHPEIRHAANYGLTHRLLFLRDPGRRIQIHTSAAAPITTRKS